MVRGRISRAVAIELVQRIMDGDGSDEQVMFWLDELKRCLVCPHISDLIFWAGDPEPTAAEVVDRALAYRPIEL